MTFRKILVALDQSKNTNFVFEQGVAVAQTYDADLILVHCVADQDVQVMANQTPTAGIGLSWPTATLPTTAAPIDGSGPSRKVIVEHMRHQLNRVEEWLQGYQQKAKEAECKSVTYQAPTGKPGDRICEVAKESDVDLIVVGRKDRSSIEEFFLGSVSSAVVHHAPCSVLVVQ